MKLRKITTLLLLMVTLVVLCSCDTQVNYEGVKVVFELEGGIYQNCELPITYYYDFDEGTILIKTPSDITENKVTRANYSLAGWYRTKTVNGAEVIYSDEWDFKTDRITTEGVVLYAKWVPNIVYSYEVCYYDENNKVQVLGSYAVGVGEKFSDNLGYSKLRYGYTPISYKNADGSPWDNDYKHPGGEESLAVQVFVEYIEGEYAVVRTISDLRLAKSKNIYLAADLDLTDVEFNFGGYKGIFEGNGHTISNMVVSIKGMRDLVIEDFEDSSRRALCVSTFGNIENATIRNVTFENISVEFETTLSTINVIYVAPIAVLMTNSTINNVTFTGNYSWKRLPSGFDEENNLIVVEERAYYKKDDNSSLENVSVEFSKKTV